MGSMPLESLKIEHLRNISQAELRFSPGLNLIAGPNASGKTSLLEGIALLTQGRSFRTSRIDQLIQHQSSQLILVGRIRTDNHHHLLGFARENKATQVKVDGQLLKRGSDLIELLPLYIITPESHEILAQGPKMRRQFLDWGVFHVKPPYLACWQRYHRVLRQRNHVLRSGGPVQAVQAWDSPLVAEAQQLHTYRRDYVDSLLPAFKRFCHDLLEITVELHYRPGWEGDKRDYAAQLKAKLSSDQERGFTQIGPHRADLALKINGQSVMNVFSRGQQKLLICAMYLAQVANAARSGILLIDDLPSELDVNRRTRLLTAAAATGVQLFITSTEANLIPIQDWHDKKVFHVEHGEFREVV